MNKLAVFVEGHAEVAFMEKLIEEIAGEKNVLIEQREIRGGKHNQAQYASHQGNSAQHRPRILRTDL